MPDMADEHAHRGTQKSSRMSWPVTIALAIASTNFTKYRPALAGGGGLHSWDAGERSDGLRLR